MKLVNIEIVQVLILTQVFIYTFRTLYNKRNCGEVLLRFPKKINYFQVGFGIFCLIGMAYFAIWRKALDLTFLIGIAPLFYNRVSDDVITDRGIYSNETYAKWEDIKAYGITDHYVEFEHEYKFFKKKIYTTRWKIVPEQRAAIQALINEYLK